MKKILLALSFLLALCSTYVGHAQVMKVSATKTIAGGGGSSLVGDLYLGEAGYSLSKLKTGYAGAAVRIRRGGDDAQQDVGFSGNDFNGSSFSTFVGGGDGHGYVVKLYDQFGNGHDLISSGTHAEEAELILNALDGTRPGIVFDGVNDALAVPNYVSAPTAFTLFAVEKATVGAGEINGHFITYSADATGTFFPFVDENVYDGFGTTARKSAGAPPSSIRTKNLYCVVSASGDWRNYVNNVAFFSTGTNTGDITTDLFIGYGNSSFFKGVVSEILIYTTALSTGDRNGVAGNRNTYYTIY